MLPPKTSPAVNKPKKVDTLSPGRLPDRAQIFAHTRCQVRVRSVIEERGGRNFRQGARYLLQGYACAASANAERGTQIDSFLPVVVGIGTDTGNLIFMKHSDDLILAGNAGKQDRVERQNVICEHHVRQI
ncbi:hypothetical protein DYBT9623_04164 [Dyadobacter sp. CECT 9623]|uniref:Uncharacterized protein n=1 Tax=Dyadobacter linearis TaxID=2823330 RepID=A0ABM8UVU1_9BACT|nr:hypothetical protein DYBT9623_04164 [Dyadobacter sp. CECT 9623]